MYDNGDIDLFKIAYDFEFETETRIDPGLRAELFEIVEEWQKRHQSEELPYLIFTKSMDFLIIYDGRSIEGPVKTRLEGPPPRLDHPIL